MAVLENNPCAICGKPLGPGDAAQIQPVFLCVNCPERRLLLALRERCEQDRSLINKMRRAVGEQPWQRRYYCGVACPGFPYESSEKVRHPGCMR